MSFSAKIEGNELVIRLPLETPRASASGKTLVVASSYGNKATDAEVAGQKIIVGVNAYIPLPKDRRLTQLVNSLLD